MIRVVFAEPKLIGFPLGYEGGNRKLMSPDFGESKVSFAARYNADPPPVRRTYTVDKFDAVLQGLSEFAADW